MNQLLITSGNNPKTLAEKMSRVLEDKADPLQTEPVVVQSMGLGQWLSLELAETLGCFAHFELVQPNAFIHDLFSALVPEVKNQKQPFSSEAMTWRIVQALPELLETAPFTALARYLENDPNQSREFSLCRKIAQSYDRYLMFRPDMVLQWDKGGGQHWQAVLWRAVSKEAALLHRPALARAFFRALDQAPENDPRLPSRVCLFGISALPPFLLEWFARVAQKIPVHLFHLNPCREYWADIASDRRIARVMRRMGEVRKDPEKPPVSPEDLHLEKGNPLLSSWGGAGQEFLAFLLNLESEFELDFTPPEGDSLLARVQKDILDMDQPGQGASAQRALDPDDKSLAVHSCHGPSREAEVLYDQILGLLNDDPELNPQDIGVLCPDLDTYAPFIQAVFQTPESPDLAVPFTLAARQQGESPAVEAFFALLDLAESRFAASRVMDLLSMEPVARAFNLSEADLALAVRWVFETRVRWAKDAEQKKELGLPETGENTWRAGMDRLFMGFAMEPDGDSTAFGILPFEGPEGQESRVLGELARFLHELFDLTQKIQEPQSPRQWSRLLGRALETFVFPGTDWGQDTDALGQALEALAKGQEQWRCERELSITVVRRFLEGRLQSGLGAGRIIRRGVTFCDIRDGAGIPFEAVFVLGANDGVFPRMDRTPGFDYMARHPRPGDRSAHQEDRSLFLQALVSARKYLSVIYTGQSVDDNSPLAPSSLVGELLDYLDEEFEVKGDRPSQKVTVIHKLQASDPEYFSGSGPLFSFGQDLCEAARTGTETRRRQSRFFPGHMEDPDESFFQLNLRDLEAFFKNPSQFLLERRLEIFLKDPGQTILEDDEPFEISGLERYALDQKLLNQCLSGKNPMDWLDPARKQGLLPHGTPGDLAFEKQAAAMEALHEKVKGYLPESPLWTDIREKMGRFTLEGRVGPLGRRGLVLFRPATAKPKDWLGAWVRHLALQLASEQGGPGRETILAATDGMWFLPALDPARSRDLLSRLLDLYFQGLCAPLPFFPETSMEFCESRLKNGKDLAGALKAASNKWCNDRIAFCDAKDPYFDLCFDGLDPTEGPEVEAFVDTALAVFEPLLEIREDLV